MPSCQSWAEDHQGKTNEGCTKDIGHFDWNCLGKAYFISENHYESLVIASALNTPELDSFIQFHTKKTIRGSNPNMHNDA